MILVTKEDVVSSVKKFFVDKLEEGAFTKKDAALILLEMMSDIVENVEPILQLDDPNETALVQEIKEEISKGKQGIDLDQSEFESLTEEEKDKVHRNYCASLVTDTIRFVSEAVSKIDVPPLIRISITNTTLLSVLCSFYNSTKSILPKEPYESMIGHGANHVNEFCADLKK